MELAVMIPRGMVVDAYHAGFGIGRSMPYTCVRGACTGPSVYSHERTRAIGWCRPNGRVVHCPDEIHDQPTRGEARERARAAHYWHHRAWWLGYARGLR